MPYEKPYRKPYKKTEPVIVPKTIDELFVDIKDVEHQKGTLSKLSTIMFSRLDKSQKQDFIEEITELAHLGALPK